MTGWTPLYQQIVASSIWGAEDHVRIAWITLLAVANKHGIATITEGGLARLAVLSREKAADALKVLSSPDLDTLTQEYEGRRIERVENGWKLLNFQKYRELARKQAINEQNAMAQAKYRDKKKKNRNSEYLPDESERSTENNHAPLPKESLEKLTQDMRKAVEEPAPVEPPVTPSP
jgi:hypothetical protein